MPITSSDPSSLRRAAHGRGSELNQLQVVQNLKRPVFSTRFDRANGAVGAKRLAALVALLIVIGATSIYLVQRHIAATDTWEVTVTGVGTALVNFTFDEESGDQDVASFPEGMKLEVGDEVLVHTDADKGNSVVKLLGD